MQPRSPDSPWNYTRAQRIGLVALLVLIAGIYGLTRLHTVPENVTAEVDDEALFAAAAELRNARPQGADATPPPSAAFTFDPNRISAADLQRLGLSAKQATAYVRYRTKVPFRRAEELRNLRVLRPEQADKLIALARIPAAPASEAPEADPAEEAAPPQNFPFDPNTLAYDSLRLLGLTEREANALIKYRSYRPITFRQAKDLRRVRALDSQRVERLMALVRLPVADTSSSPAPRSPQTLSATVDINRATAQVWQQLPGIGAYRAQSIVKFRDRLGGFASVDQVATTYGLPDSVFQQIRKHLVASPIVRPLYVNRADAATLAAHPFLQRSTATIIVRYRDNHGPFRSVEDLKKVRALTTETLDELLPYLNFAP